MRAIVALWLWVGAAVAGGSEWPASGHRAGADFPRCASCAAPDSLFRFHSRFWVNLHHYAYEQALLTADPARAGGTSGVVATLEGLGEEERVAWQRIVEHYRQAVIDHDLLFNERLVRLDWLLGQVDDEAGGPADGAALVSAGVDPELAALLAEAAPAYRSAWWPAHDAANEEWIDEVSPLADRYAELASRLAADYQAEWPREPIDVDVLVFANWAGAYTTTDPNHIRVSASLEANRDLGGLEMLFHEASHTMVSGRRGAVGAGVRREAERLGIDTPRRVWHAILFYTTGERVGQRLEQDGVTDFVPFAEAYGLWERGEWPVYRSALEEYWQPYLDGRVTFDEALAGVVEALR